MTVSLKVYVKVGFEILKIVCQKREFKRKKVKQMHCDCLLRQQKENL